MDVLNVLWTGHYTTIIFFSFDICYNNGNQATISVTVTAL